MADGLEIELVSGREIKQVVDALRQVDKKAPARVRKEMRTIARSGAKVVKTKARKLPAKGVAGGTQARPHKRRQLRRALARGVKIQASTGGRRGTGLRIVTSMESRSQAFLPRAMDLVPSWSHPLFGTQRTVTQQGGHGWFVAPLGEMRPEMEQALRKLVDDSVEEIRRAGG